MLHRLTDTRAPYTARPYPALTRDSQTTEQESAYYAALELVAEIDDNLASGTGHYYAWIGEELERLGTLGEVVWAIMVGTLVTKGQTDDQ